MSHLHAPASEFPAPASGTGKGLPSDPLADALNMVRLFGALMFQVKASDPWCVDIPHTDTYRTILATPRRHVISYHVVLEGAGIAAVPGEAPVRFEKGDIIVFPQGDAYRMESAAGTPPEFSPEETIHFFESLVAGQLPVVVTEGGGGEPPAGFLCGFLTCEARPFNPVLAKLPRMLVVKLPDREEDSLARLIEVACAEFRVREPGAHSTRLHLCELIFIETLRRHVVSTGGPSEGWLSALADPVAGPAIAAIHAEPMAEWSLERLARQVPASRSVLAERFAQAVGQGPMQYVTAWRMQIAAELLRQGGSSIADVAWSVGYRSEAAFSRAFKKAAGMPPGAWRRTR